MRATLLAAAAATATLLAQPALSATVQSRLIVSDIGSSAKLVDVVRSRGGGGWGHRAWGHRGWGHRGWGHRGWGWRRGWGGWGWGGGWPAYDYSYAGDCPYDVWTYRWGCVPYGVYDGPGFGYGAPQRVNATKPLSGS